MDILLRGCAGGGDPGGEIFQASLQYCQVQSRRGPSKTRHVVQKWIRNPIFHVRLIKLKKAHSIISNFCFSYDAVKNVKPAKEWRDEECEVSSRSLFDGSYLVISKTKLGDAGTYRYTALVIRHSLHSSCTPLNFPKLYFNLTKLPPHLSNFQKRVSEVSLFCSVIRKSVLVFLQG